MCTVREIQEAIREHCHSQHDMESTEIDQVRGAGMDQVHRADCAAR